jgi:hypothetical protein
MMQQVKNSRKPKGLLCNQQLIEMQSKGNHIQPRKTPLFVKMFFSNLLQQHPFLAVS